MNNKIDIKTAKWTWSQSLFMRLRNSISCTVYSQIFMPWRYFADSVQGMYKEYTYVLSINTAYLVHYLHVYTLFSLTFCGLIYRDSLTAEPLSELKQ